jgi:hypothetical protein
MRVAVINARPDAVNFIQFVPLSLRRVGSDKSSPQSRIHFCSLEKFNYGFLRVETKDESRD